MSDKLYIEGIRDICTGKLKDWKWKVGPMSDEETTRRVTPAELKENFELRDEIKQLRILVAAIIRDQGGRIYVSTQALVSIGPRDTFTQEDAAESNHIVLTFEGE